MSKLKQGIGTKFLMSKYTDHWKSFPDTHSNIWPTIDICNIVPIVLQGSRGRKEQF